MNAMKSRTFWAGLLASSIALASAAAADEQLIAEQIVDAMNKVFGPQRDGFRANHAKGIVVEGSFKATPEASKLSKAALFSGAAIPVTARFSDASGLPHVPDGADAANPHGVSIKFHLPDGSDSDLVINALHFFPVSNGADFRDMFLAIADSPPDASKPTKLDQFMAAHPNVQAANATVSTPASFAEEEYFGVNAFVFVNKDGARQPFRYHMTPERVAHLTTEDAAKKAPNFLIDEIGERLKKGPVTFHLKAQLAESGDQTSDGSKPWPDDRRQVDMGVLAITNVASDSQEKQAQLLFLPGQLPDGIEQSDDPMIDIRNSAYPVSFARRFQQDEPRSAKRSNPGLGR
jgi:catalase